MKKKIIEQGLTLSNEKKIIEQGLTDEGGAEGGV